MGRRDLLCRRLHPLSSHPPLSFSPQLLVWTQKREQAASFSCWLLNACVMREETVNRTGWQLMAYNSIAPSVTTFDSPEFVEKVGREFNVSPEAEVVAAKRSPLNVIHCDARQIRQHCTMSKKKKRFYYGPNVHRTV